MSIIKERARSKERAVIRIAAVSLAILLLGWLPAEAQIKRWVADDGTVLLSNAPSPPPPLLRERVGLESPRAWKDPSAGAALRSGLQSPRGSEKLPGERSSLPAGVSRIINPSSPAADVLIWKSSDAFDGCLAEMKTVGRMGPVCVAGIIGSVSPGTRARRISGLFALFFPRVQILEGRNAGIVGHIPLEFFKK